MKTCFDTLSQDIIVYNDDCLEGEGGEGGGERLAIAHTEDQQYSLMPNPNDGNMLIRQSLRDTQQVRVKVYSVLGSLIYSAMHSFDANVTALDLSRMPSGIYHVSLEDSYGRNYSLQFVKK